MSSFNINADIYKAIKDENGDWIVEGIASTAKRDYEDERVLPQGLDLSYFIKKGFIKYEHGKSPKQFIGEPLEARIVPQGFYIKGKLYRHSPMAKEAVDALETLEKSGAKRGLHWSIEASTLERDPKDPTTVTKAIVRNVVLTFNPVNDETWAKLCKSLSTAEWDAEFDTQCECGHKCGANCQHSCQKSLSTDSSSGQALMPESLEGGNPSTVTEEDTDEHKKRIKLAFSRYMAYLLKHALKKRQLQKSLVVGLTAEDMRNVFNQAAEGLLPVEADGLASYILTKSVNIDLLAKKFAGGEDEMYEDLAKALDSALTDLNKSLNITDDELKKSMGDDSDGDDGDENLEGEHYQASEEGGENKTDTDVDKSFAEEFAKQDESIAKALEVSDFLEMLVGAVGDSIDGFGETINKSFNKAAVVQASIGNALIATGNLMKSLLTEVTELRSEQKSNIDLIKSLQAELETIAGQPVGRKSIVNAKEVQTLTKSFGYQNQQGKRLTKSQIVDMLVKSFDKGEKVVSPMDVTRFETSGTIRREVAEHLGLVDAQ